MKSSSTDLFDLIQSLTKSEKRYFTLYVRKYLTQEQADYLTLFRAVAKQKEHDEIALKKALSKEGLIKRLPVVKHYLYNLILKSLRDFHAGDNVDLKIMEQLQHANLLYNRGLYKQAAKILSKVKKFAEKREAHVYLLMINGLEKSLYLIRSNIEHMREQYATLMEHERGYFEKLSNARDYFNLFFTFQNRLLKEPDASGSAQEGNALSDEQIFTHHLLRDESLALSHKAKVWFNLARASLSANAGRLTDATQYLIRARDLYQSLPDDGLPIQGYIGILGNLHFLYLQLEQWPECNETLEELHSLKRHPRVLHSEFSQAKLFTSLYTCELSYCARTGQYDRGLQLESDIAQGAEKYRGKIGNIDLFILCGLVANLYFGAGEFRRALAWRLHAQEYYFSEPKELREGARVFDLVIHYELGDDDLLDNRAAGILRATDEGRTLLPDENEALKFIIKSLKGVSPAEIERLQTDLYHALQRNREAYPQQTHTFAFDYLPWSESKVTGEPYADIIRKRIEESSVATP